MPAPRYRPELQGLRALAISLVVIYHVWIGRVSGGVDTFLFISMFLMTLSFSRLMRDEATLHLPTRWTRTFKRLVPLAALTIAGTLLVGWYLLPETHWVHLWKHGWASLFYVENWALIGDGANYFALDGVNPFTHYWSLSIQGQVFLLWPVLAWIALKLGRSRLTVTARQAFTMMMVVIFVVSLAWSIYLTSTNQPVAYFDTRSRLWEFAAGSLLALGVEERQFKTRYGVIAGWVGVAGLISCGLILDVETGFPGFIALWPLACAALIICAGDTRSRFGVDKLLGSRLAVGFGNMSYAVYLLHWPILEFWRYWTSREQPGPYSGTAIIGLTLVAAFMATKMIDEPLRRLPMGRRPLRGSLALIASFLAVVSLPLAAWQYSVSNRPEPAVTVDHPGAAVTVDDTIGLRPGVEPVPDPTALNKEWVGMGTPCTGERVPLNSSVQEICHENIVENSELDILLIGNSHMEQMYQPFSDLAATYSWSVTNLVGQACPFGESPGPSWDEDFDCSNKFIGAREYVDQVEPDVVVVHGSFVNLDRTEVVLPGVADALADWSERGIHVVMIRDNPRFDYNPTTCALDNGADSRACQSDADMFYPADSGWDELRGDRIYPIDLTDTLCPDGTCQPIVGNMYVWIDEHHVTKTYMTTVAPALEAKLKEAGFPYLDDTN